MQELEHALTQINAQIDAVQAYAVGAGERASEMKTSTGQWVMIPLLAAKVTALNAISTIRADIVRHERNLEAYRQAEQALKDLAGGRVTILNQNFETAKDDDGTAE